MITLNRRRLLTACTVGIGALATSAGSHVQVGLIELRPVVYVFVIVRGPFSNC